MNMTQIYKSVYVLKDCISLRNINLIMHLVCLYEFIMTCHKRESTALSALSKEVKELELG